MSDVKQVTPEEVVTLLEQGYVYVDVRSEPEFEQGHPPGALNVPISHATPTGMAPNPEFAEVMQRAFGKDEKLIVGCKAGTRSKRAIQQLLALGFTNLSEMGVGWDGNRDAFGRLNPGWSQKGLPIESGKPQGQAYADVKQRVPR